MLQPNLFAKIPRNGRGGNLPKSSMDLFFRIIFAPVTLVQSRPNISPEEMPVVIMKSLSPLHYGAM